MGRALVKLPSANFASGLTSQQGAVPDVALAASQHAGYQRALQELGLDLIVLPADPLPDSCFVEDMAVLAPPLVIATRSGPRAAEQGPVLQALLRALPEYRQVAIQAPGNLEGGDVLRMGRHWWVGLSERTNEAGADQFRAWLEPHGYTVSTVEVSGLLHLKTGVSRLKERTVLAIPQFADTFARHGYHVVPIEPEDGHAANALALGSRVLLPAGYGRVVRSLARLGFRALEVELSEFRKQDGGASCLSIWL